LAIDRGQAGKATRRRDGAPGRGDGGRPRRSGATRRSGGAQGAAVCVTGATGFLGAHLARTAARRGYEVQAVYRSPERLERLPEGGGVGRAKGDVLDLASLRRAVRGAEVLFHTAGYVGSRPAERVWAMNARSPRIAVEAAAAEDVRRVVVTSSIAAIGPADSAPADERNPYPEDGLGLEYADSKRRGEEEALEAGEGFGVEVVVVNPSYVLGAPVDRSQPGETSTRIIGNYLLGRLPGVVDAVQNFVDVEDVATGHLLAAERGRAGERYILGGANVSWAELMDRVAEISGVRHPLLVFPGVVADLAQLRERAGLPGMIAAEGYALMAADWRCSSDKARRELGFETRSIDETLETTVGWYRELIDRGSFRGRGASAMSIAAAGLRLGEPFGMVTGLRLAERIVRRRLVCAR
jgi:dihydroflavonol-4-reductase